MSSELADRIKELAQDIGYADCGITSIEPFREFGRTIDERIERFPETEELYAPMRGRTDPRSSARWARSIVVCVRRYGKYGLPEGLPGHIGRSYLVDRRFEGCPDHVMPKQMKEGLAGMGFRVKNAGVPDRWAAARAGITRFGRNCFAYSKHGSWINIETWSVDKDLPPDEPTLDTPCPENCRACIDACPTGALTEPFVMRMDRCVAHLTYKAPEPIAPDLWGKMGKWIYGCDACQEACPLNKEKWESVEETPWLDDVAQYLTPDALSTMSEETYHEIVHPRFWYIPKDNLKRWHLNAKRVLEALRH